MAAEYCLNFSSYSFRHSKFSGERSREYVRGMSILPFIFFVDLISLHKDQEATAKGRVRPTAMGLQKNKNEQFFVGYFCGKHAMGAKKREMFHFFLVGQYFFCSHLRK